MPRTDDPFMRCNHREHNPPMHLYIAPGSSYTHICPGCGYWVVLTNPLGMP